MAIPHVTAVSLHRNRLAAVTCVMTSSTSLVNV